MSVQEIFKIEMKLVYLILDPYHGGQAGLAAHKTLKVVFVQP